MTRRKVPNPSPRTLAQRRRRAAETPAQRKARQAKMRARARGYRRERYRKSKARHTPQERDLLDAIRAGRLTAVTAKELREPRFVVITPQGRRIETLAPDIA